ncbi:TIGR02391 family protein [Neisseria zalophi]|uniref:TIGR02391 family protein n=1 Tax=Neisseria zalophi TaxID=640030 RepID=A0A5J6PRN3_9NEIS|nr:TIGR02391 family protein [Neisseria zalophi]QEY25371.1 TIGR02391 family protein [Neisseria zalophi]
MSQQQPFNEGTIEALARVLGECGSGTDITRILNDRGLPDHSGESTKWRRLYFIFLTSQKETNSPNKILDFIRSFLTPARFVGRNEELENHRTKLNTILVMVGLELGKDGQFRIVHPATTLDEAEKRVQTIRERLKGRAIHSEVEKYCRAELMQENYFHAVFEASKGLAQRIRELSGTDGDGAQLIDKVFSVERPLLAINTLRTETEKSEHKGFAQLLKGCFAAIRNPLAHEPKILWSGENDTADYLSLLSLLHRKLDDAVPTRLGKTIKNSVKTN